MNVLSLDGVGAFILLVLPGAISLQVYRMILPGRPTPWSESIYQAVFYSLLNFAVLFPICLFLLDGTNLAAHPLIYWLALVVVLLAAPIAQPSSS